MTVRQDVSARTSASAHFEFLITTQAEHSISSKKYARISEARSYLATRNHARRRQSQDPTGFGADPLLQTSANIRPYTCAEKETSAQLGRATRCRNRSPNTNVSNPHAIQGFKGFHESKSLSPMVTGIHCALDPFLQVKLDLSTQEKSLIHFCKSVTTPVLPKPLTVSGRSTCWPVLVIRYSADNFILPSSRHCTICHPDLSYICSGAYHYC